MKIKYLALMLSASVFIGCGSRVNSGDDSAKDGFKVEGDIVTVSDSSPVAEKLVLETVDREDIGSGFVTTAAVTPRPDAYAEVRTEYSSYLAAVKASKHCSDEMLADARSILESRKSAYTQGDSSLLDYLLAVRVYNDTAESCIGAKAAVMASWARLLAAIGVESL